MYHYFFFPELVYLAPVYIMMMYIIFQQKKDTDLKEEHCNVVLRGSML